VPSSTGAPFDWHEIGSFQARGVRILAVFCQKMPKKQP
jgi:hypothetical protein